ncbi:MAG TPA: SRPBCC family protein [Candidatus Eisenbacteria bacterium]|nr:SRPBCC family protein [Candidatus Eisenbacteria bacterium]
MEMNEARWMDDGGRIPSQLEAQRALPAKHPREQGREAAWNALPPQVPGAVNVGDAERWASLLGGGVLAVYGLSRLAERDRAGALFAVMGGMLAWRGMSGHSHLYEGLHVSRFAGHGSDANAVSGQAIRIERSVVVERPARELWRMWRNLENLPRFMEHLESVLPLGGNRFHWTVRAPIGTVSWDARIIGEREGDYLAWASEHGSQVPNAGSVRFMRRGGATEVRVSIAYQPPAGPLGAGVAKLFGDGADRRVSEDLERFKQVAESGDGASLAPGGR